ncbi:MAG: Fic family protein [bacterium]|nr:Fic family protein [bacterium]MDE0351622.1 Fic family protein [bacterium]
MSEQITVPRPGRPTHNDVYHRLAVQIRELKDRLGGLPRPIEAAGIWKGIWHGEVHHSTAIEGNTLVQREVERLLEEGRAVGNRTLREYLEVKGYADAAEWVYTHVARSRGASETGAILTLADVRTVHHMAMTPVWEVAPHSEATARESPGAYREHEIRPFPTGMIPPSWPLVPGEMTAWIDEVNSLDPTVLDFPEQLALLHCRFEQIHPFLDGNGRAGRLVLNLILVRLGYPPAIIYKRDRERYLRALRRADTGEPGTLGVLIARAILDTLYQHVIPAVAGPARLVPLAALAAPDLTAPALRTAASRGRLQATRGPDGQWRSSRIWVEEYKASRWTRT